MTYRPTDGLAESRMDRLWRENANKKLAAKRSNVEMVQMLKEWGEAKANFQAESSRKNESQNYFNRFYMRG
jgi:hypothetical protein